MEQDGGVRCGPGLRCVLGCRLCGPYDCPNAPDFARRLLLGFSAAGDFGGCYNTHGHGCLRGEQCEQGSEYVFRYRTCHLLRVSQTGLFTQLYARHKER